MLPNIAVYHPQIVHFAVALLIVGTGLRVVSLTGWPRFANGAAATLLLLGSVSAFLAARSGHEAHGPVERIPGTRAAVTEHEEWGERTRNVFIVVGALELLALAFVASPSRKKVAKGIHVASSLVALAGVGVLYEAAEHGGHLVYVYAGGVGTRSGNPEDVNNLLVAGLYNQAQLDRREHKNDEAARLIDELARQRPTDPSVALMHAESQMRDRNDPQATLDELRRLNAPADNLGVRYRVAMLQVDAFKALGQPDSAHAILQKLADSLPADSRLRPRVDSMLSGG